MEYIINTKRIKSHNLIFRNPIKNQNEKFINFYKLIYSDSFFTLKYMLLSFNLINYNIIISNNNYLLYIEKDDLFFKQIKDFEKMILETLNVHINKKIVYNCYNELINKQFIYCFQSYPDLKHFCIKISGIWEDKVSIGLVYKIYYNTSTQKLPNINC